MGVVLKAQTRLGFEKLERSATSHFPESSRIRLKNTKQYQILQCRINWRRWERPSAVRQKFCYREGGASDWGVRALGRSRMRIAILDGPAAELGAVELERMLGRQASEAAKL